MLIIYNSISHLDFGQLMTVYTQSNLQAGAGNYPDFSRDRQLYEAEQDFYLFLREFFCVPDSVYLLWAPGGVYKSALRLEPYRDGMLAEGLETAPDSRRKGYAKQLLTAAIAYASGRNCSCIYSHIDKNNIPSRKLHIACGFHKISDYAVYIDGSVDHKSATYKKACSR